MIRLLGPGARLCDGYRRREILRIGGLGLLGGLGLPDLSRADDLSAPAPAGDGFGKAKSCILLFLMGGPPQHSTWDPKPDAPAEVRGDFGPIATTVPGLSLCELLPHTAQVADKLCLLRAVSTGDNAHSSSGYYMLTGRPHQPKNFENANPGPPNDSPSIGALLGRVARADGPMPPSVTLPMRIFNTDGSVWPGQDAGFLGRAADPWLLNARPTPEGYRIREIDLPAELDPARLGDRMELLDRIERRLDSQALAPEVAFDEHSRRAFDLLRSNGARRAFDLEAEPRSVRERYGETPFGQGVLLARRLVEAGVRLVQVNWYRGPDEPPANPCWDSHVAESSRLKDVLVPPTDLAFSALIEDLDRRGLLDETLVVCMAEFGRSPRLDPNGGRGHWGSVFSVALAGGGVNGGQVHGSSDQAGAYPRDGLVRPEDLTATLFHCLGFPPHSEYRDPLGRPHPISRGEVIHAIL
ncbi:DUF1501 domain-containing protein [Tautonia sociabilis]|uniref:DUF1501 domain-containing protein n=1 Tax=Tautonia sociabilis TaxID=2080755 RepID=A0A432MKA2_9BACT|nr:DUF1501 domain-containing protein [Tautonia sociabilis]RUL87844.1 DUF1501 domain-containing protein [Tautonia sociabilis]